MLAGSAPASAAEAAGPARPRAEIVSYGEYRARLHARLEPTPDSETGAVGLMDGEPTLAARTTEIVAAPGVSFGLVVGVPDLPADRALTVTVRLNHPPVTAPDGRVWRTETREMALTAQPKFTGFCFDQSWELAPGDWTYTLLHEDRPIASQRFRLDVDPGRAVEARCGRKDAVS